MQEEYNFLVHRSGRARLQKSLRRREGEDSIRPSLSNCRARFLIFLGRKRGLARFIGRIRNPNFTIRPSFLRTGPKQHQHPKEKGVRARILWSNTAYVSRSKTFVHRESNSHERTFFSPRNLVHFSNPQDGDVHLCTFFRRKSVKIFL
jgi:hypothetical protein